MIPAAGRIYRNKAGDLISLHDWLELYADHEYARIALDQVGPLRISTIWLGVDIDRDGTIFETKIFLEDCQGHLGDEIECFRFCTVQDAEREHTKIVDYARSTALPTLLALRADLGVADEA